MARTVAEEILHMALIAQMDEAAKSCAVCQERKNGTHLQYHYVVAAREAEDKARLARSASSQVVGGEKR